MTILVADLECNSLYRDTDRIHCIATVDVDTKEKVLYEPDDVYDGLVSLYHADTVVFHNGAGFDVPLIQKLYPKFTCNLLDTLCFSRLLDPDRPRHSIESYGKQFGNHKVVHEDWSKYTKGMGIRCLRDIDIGLELYLYLINKAGDWDWSESLQLEQEVATIHLFQTLAGVDIDVPFAESVVDEIDLELEEIEIYLGERMPLHFVSTHSVPVNKPFIKSGDYSAAVKKYFGGR